MSGVTPYIAVQARCVGGSTHHVSIKVGSTQRKTLVIRWLLGASHVVLSGVYFHGNMRAVLCGYKTFLFVML